jgi:hypothetical protein
MSLKQDARNRGIRLTYEKNGKRYRKSESRIIKEIRNHDDSIISKRARQTKGMILMCKSVLGALNNQPRAAPKMKVSTPFVTPPTSPKKMMMMKPPPPPPPPPPGMLTMGIPKKKNNGIPNLVKKANYQGTAIPMSLMNNLKRAIKKKSNQTAKK